MKFGLGIACTLLLLFVIISSAKRPHKSKNRKKYYRSKPIAGADYKRYDIHDAEFTVGMVRQYQEYQEYICAGVIITKFWALTSPSCSLKATRGEILLGKVILRGGTKYIEGTGGFEHRINQIKRIGLLAFLEVVNPFINEPYEVPVPLIASRRYNYTDVEAEVFGWGEIVDEGTTALFLRGSKVKLIKNNDCSDYYPSVNNRRKNVVCGFNVDKYACQGHAGGPLIHNNVLVGISLRAYHDCEENHPELYTRISAYAWRIFYQTKDLSLDYSPPIYSKPH